MPEAGGKAMVVGLLQEDGAGERVHGPCCSPGTCRVLC